MFRKTFIKRAWVYTKGKMETYTNKYTKRKPFSPKFYVKNIELLPIMTICILDCFMVAYCSIRTFLSTDLKYAKHIKNRGEDIELLKNPRCLKFYCPSQEYVPNMDLYNLYQEMNGADPVEEESKTKDVARDTVTQKSSRASSKESSRRGQVITITKDSEDTVTESDCKASSEKSKVETRKDSSDGSLSLKEIKQKLVIKNDKIQSPEILFGESKNAKMQTKMYSQNGIRTVFLTTKTTYSKGYQVVQDDTTVTDESKNGKNPAFQKVITIIHPSGESVIAMKKFYLDKDGKKVEIKEDEWMRAYPTAIPQDIEPDLQRKMTTQVKKKRKEEEDKITENIITTKTFDTGAKKIKEETIVTDTKGKSPPKDADVSYYLVMSGNQINIDEDSWNDADIISTCDGDVTVETERKTDADGVKTTIVTTTSTFPNGDKHIEIETTTEDKSGNKSYTTEHQRQKKGEKRQLPITEFSKIPTSRPVITMKTESNMDANGSKITIVTITVTEPNGKIHTQKEVTTVDKSGNKKTTRAVTYKQKTNK